MQENNTEQAPSLSQLLRVSYLSEAQTQHRHGEMNRSDASSSRLQIYGSLKGKGDEAFIRNDTQYPDLSAFLSQEELDKSVNLARQAIGHEPHGEKTEVKSSGTPQTHSNISSATVSLAPPPSIPVSNNSPSFVADNTPSCNTSTPDKNVQKPPARRDNTVRNSVVSNDGLDNRTATTKNAPYGMETQSKKEFLNKAADFIEELSSLFKANSSKRIRPRSCKTHRSRIQNKMQNNEGDYPLSSDSRERVVIPVEAEGETPNLTVSPKSEEEGHQILESGLEEFQNCVVSDEEEFSAGPLATEVQAESFVPNPTDPPCEPPHFIQKLKSREVPEGTKVQLDCIVGGHPVPEVRWFCEGKELENSPDIQIITNGELHSLIIAEAFEEDTGRYSCFASNFYGTDSTSAEIYVEGASSSDSEGEQHFENVSQLQSKGIKSPPSMSSSSNQARASEGESVKFEPSSTIEEPEEELPTSQLTQDASEELFSIKASAIIHSVPEVSKVSLSQPGQDEATVLPVQLFAATTGSKEIKEAQEVSASIPVTSAPQLEQTATGLTTSLPLNPAVTSALAILSAPFAPQLQVVSSQNPPSSNHNILQGFEGQTVMTAPVFTKSLQDLTASEGQLVVLECRIKGVLSPRVDWYKDGKLLEDSPECRILQKKPRSPAESEEICTLVIAEVFLEDSGMFTCVANNPYGSVSSSAILSIKGNGTTKSHLRPFTSSLSESHRVQDLSPSSGAMNCKAEVTVSTSVKPHSSTIRLEPLVSSTVRLEPLNTSTLRLEPSSLTSLSSSNLDPLSVHCGLSGPSGAHTELQSGRQIFQKAFTISPASITTPEQQASRASAASFNTSLKVKETLNSPNASTSVVPLPDPPPNSCLKTSTQTNQKDSRSSARVGLHVHFKLPEDDGDEPEDPSAHSDEDINQSSSSKEPPPVLAKPKLDPAQLQLLHNQVLMEQQQETEPQTHVKPPSKPAFQTRSPSETQSHREGPTWSSRMHREPQVPSFNLISTTTAPHQTPPPAPPLTNTYPTPSALNATLSPLGETSSAPPPAVPHLNASSPETIAPLSSQLSSPPSFSITPVSQTYTIHASHLNLSPAALSRNVSKPQFTSPFAPKLSTVPESTFSFEQITSPTPQLRSTHASLMNLSALSNTFNYVRPKEFLVAQTFSPVRSPSPTESPVPLLQELAAELNSSATSSPIPPPFSPPLRLSPTRVLRSPTSPPSLVSSPTPGSMPFMRAQSPPQASSPTSSSSSPSPIQNPVAFLSSVLPSLTPSQPTNAMGLPKGAPSGGKKKAPKTRLPPAENPSQSRELLLQDIEKKLQFRKETHAYQQKLSIKGKTASRPLGANIGATVINYDEEYKVSNFEQRLMSEIEFRLERTPVEESDDEVQHGDVPSGKCIAPLFEKKLKNYKAMEGVPVTFTCKVLGVPPPKVYWFKDGKQILKNNIHYRKLREGDGTCSLHMESATNDDDGNYTIMAANPQGRISCSGHLIIQSGPPRNRLTPVQSQRVRARIQEVEGEQTQERFFRPHFLQAPGDMMAHEGRLCRLDCKVSGLPNPELMWLVNGRPIYPDITHKMLVRENGIHSLVIDPLTQNDAGTYTCIASNKAGQSSFSLELSVVEKEMTQPPQFVEKLQNMGIPEGSPVRLECRVMGMPPPVIFWKKDNETISKTKHRISMNQDTTGYVCLFIQPTTRDDAGWYTVSAKNEAGIVSCTCRLDIYAQWHQSIPAPMRKAPRTSRYAALTGQGLDIRSAFATADTSPILFASSPPEATLESEEL